MAVTSTYTYKRQREYQPSTFTPVQGNYQYNRTKEYQRGQTDTSEGVKGVTQQTQQRLAQLQQGYTPSQQVSNLLGQLQNTEAAKPGPYTYSNQQQLQDMYNKVMQKPDFKYDLANDPLYRQAADQFTRQGRQASLDAQGQAAGLTGGYGNSYGAMVGNQAYQQNLNQLNAIVPDLEARAFQEHQAGLDNDIARYQLGLNDKNMDYGMYRDTVGDWENQRAYDATRYDTERGFDYGTYEDAMNAMMSQQQIENADWLNRQQMAEEQRQYDENQLENQWQYDTGIQQAIDRYNVQDLQWNAQMAENIRNTDNSMYEEMFQADQDNARAWAGLEEQQRQFDANLTEEQRQNNEQYAMNLVSAILANGQMPSDELLVAAGLSYPDAQKLMAKVKSVGGTTTTPKKEEDAGDKKLIKNSEVQGSKVANLLNKINGTGNSNVGVRVEQPESNAVIDYNDWKKLIGIK